MKTISIRELHEKTGEWVRRSEKLGTITVTDRGKAVAQIIPVEASAAVNPFAQRKLRRAYSRMLAAWSGRPAITYKALGTLSEASSGAGSLETEHHRLTLRAGALTVRPKG